MAAIIYGNVYMLWRLMDTPVSSNEARWFSQRMVWDWVLIGIFVAVATLQGLYNSLGWMNVGLAVIFAILFALDGFKS